MEWRIMMPIVLGLVALAMFVLAEWRMKRRAIRAFTAGVSLLLAAIAVWDFKELEKRWEQHFLLQSAGQSILGISKALEQGRQDKLLQVLKKWEGDGSLYHLSRVQVERIRDEIFQANDSSGVQPPP